MQLRQLIPDLARAFRKFLWNLHLNHDVEIAALSGGAGKAAFAQTKALAALCSRRNFQPNGSLQGWHFQFRSKHRLPRRDFHFVNEIAALHSEFRMFGQPNAQEQIATFAASSTRLALASQSNSLTFVHAARDFYLVGFHFIRTGPAQRHRPSRAVQRFFQGHQDIGFDVGSPFRGCLTPAESAKSGAPAAAAEKGFKKIAKPGAAEFKLHAATPIRLMEAAAGLRSPLWRRLKSAGLVPVRAELIVFLALVRIAQDFVGLIDLLEFFLGRFFVLRDVRMIFAREFSKRAADFVLGRFLRDTERFIIIPELDCHGTPTLCRAVVRATFSRTDQRPVTSDYLGPAGHKSTVPIKMREIGKLLVMSGAVAVILGLILWSGFAPKWLGRLPGDIRIEREHGAFYFPIVTCILVSIALSLLFAIFRR